MQAFRGVRDEKGRFSVRGYLRFVPVEGKGINLPRLETELRNHCSTNLWDIDVEDGQPLISFAFTHQIAGGHVFFALVPDLFPHQIQSLYAYLKEVAQFGLVAWRARGIKMAEAEVTVTFGRHLFTDRG